jgi:hypothetical protein
MRESYQYSRFVTARVMFGRRPRCKRKLAFWLRSGASHVSGLFARRLDRWPWWSLRPSDPLRQSGASFAEGPLTLRKSYASAQDGDVKDFGREYDHHVRRNKFVLALHAARTDRCRCNLRDGPIAGITLCTSCHVDDD